VSEVQRGSGAPVRVDASHHRPVQAAHVDRCRLRAIGHVPKTERLAAADAAELVLDDVAVERIGRELTGPCGNGERRPGDEPEQEPLSAAVRAIALDRLVNLSSHGELHGTAMTASGLHGASEDLTRLSSMVPIDGFPVQAQEDSAVGLTRRLLLGRPGCNRAPDRLIQVVHDEVQVDRRPMAIVAALVP
jgi:hypothetical protein